jgi:cation diffusion facilitator family transporter
MQRGLFQPMQSTPSASLTVIKVRQVTWIGLAVNIALSILKFMAGLLGRSQALVADAVHSLTDTTTDVAVIIGSYYWARPPDSDHPYGHHRVETVVTLFVGFVLCAAGLMVGWEALRSLQGEPARQPKTIALIVAAVSIVGKEALYRWTAAVSRRIKSPALAANAWHHRTDAISSLPVFLAVGGAMLFPQWSLLDRVGAVVVAIFIVHAAFKIIWPGLRELVDAGAPTEICREIMALARQNPQVQQAHGIRTRYVGSRILVDLHVVVDGGLSVKEGHDIAEDVKHRILQNGPEVIDVSVHIEPEEVALPDEACLP